jgi:hypothetical protein
VVVYSALVYRYEIEQAVKELAPDRLRFYTHATSFLTRSPPSNLMVDNYLTIRTDGILHGINGNYTADEDTTSLSPSSGNLEDPSSHLLLLPSALM